jgi:hypothetical protein
MTALECTDCKAETDRLRHSRDRCQILLPPWEMADIIYDRAVRRVRRGRHVCRIGKEDEVYDATKSASVEEIEAAGSAAGIERVIQRERAGERR